MIQIAKDWKDYELIDAGEGEKLERWGKYILQRPDPQAIWPKDKDLNSQWDKADMIYYRSNKGGGQWEKKHRIEDTWTIDYKELKFVIKPTAFKHTGVFPEQASNWEWLMKKIKESKVTNPKILNLFAYTGAATVACASAGAEVCHVDASKGMVQVAKENLKLSGLENVKTRFIVDDVVKFVEREVRRGNKYHGIIMDPPVYGRGPNGQLWEIEKDLIKLVELCKQILADDFSFILINAYATSFSSIGLENILKSVFKVNANLKLESGENALITKKGLVLPCGLFARLERL